MMSRYRGPRLKLIRKLSNLPGLTSKRIHGQRYGLAPRLKRRLKKNKKRKSIKTPGQHGKPLNAFNRRLSAYGLRLIEKQKVRFNYHLTEKQLVRYVDEAKRSSKATGDVLLNLLEMRLDNVIQRLGMAPTIIAARQLVTHGHVLVNKKKVNIPSYNCQRKDIISIRKVSSSQQLVKNNLKSLRPKWRPPRHLAINLKTLRAIVKRSASAKAVPFKLNELLVVEFYSQN